MKTEQITLTTSVLAADDMPDKSLFIGFNGAICAADAKALGVLADSVLADEQAPVSVSGIALVVAGDVVSIGDAVSSDDSGKAVTASSGEINGYALDDASEADELIRILLV